MTVVTVYTAPSCVACTMTKRHLDKRGVAYREEQFDDDTRAAAIELGFSSAPVVCASIDGVEQEPWAGYRPDQLDKLAAAA